MSSTLLQLPVNVPWTLLSASADMMDSLPMLRAGDPTAGSQRWKSSIAVFGYEPDVTDLDPTLCDTRVTFFKVSCSVTGYQPPEAELEAVLVAYPDVPAERLNRLIGSYFACYGAVLNFAVYPSPLWQNVLDSPPLDTFPRIIDFEPKKRDLYQAATENGEVLTASKSGIRTDKSLTSVDSSETGVSLGAEVPIESLAKGTAGLSHKWGQTDTDSDTTSRDASRERRETEGSTTNITQMYNLLTAYHIGTNRARFILLPRPHKLPPTVRQTFVQGIRELEGIQEFFFVVTRPREQASICLKASLETGHVVDSGLHDDPEAAAEAEWEKKVLETDEIIKGVDGLPLVTDLLSRVGELAGAEPARDEKSLARTFHGFETDGWEFDMHAGDPGHGPLEEVLLDQNSSNTFDLDNYDYQAVKPDQVIVSGTIFTTQAHSAAAVSTFHRKYKVHLKRQKSVDVLQHEDRSNLLITARDLVVCVKSEDGCLKVETGDRPKIEDSLDIIRESELTRGMSAAIISQIQAKLTDGRKRGEAERARSYLETDAFKRRIQQVLTAERRKTAIGNVSGLPASVVEALGPQTTVEEVLALDERDLLRRTGATHQDAARVRRCLLALEPREPEPKR